MTIPALCVPDVEEYFEKFNRGTTLDAEHMRLFGTTKRNRPVQLNLDSTFSVLKFLFWDPILRFGRIFLFLKAYKDGIPGLIYAIFGAFYEFVGRVKYLEMRIKESKCPTDESRPCEDRVEDKKTSAFPQNSSSIHPGVSVRSPKRRLLVFWHGIGDNIMAIPALRALKEKYPDDSLGLMYLKRIDKDGLFGDSPYIDATYTCSDAWNDYLDYDTGVTAILEEANRVAEKEGYDEIVPVTLRSCSLENHRIYRIAHELGVELSTPDRSNRGWDTELPIPQEEEERADAIFKSWGIKEDDFVVAIHRRGANVHKYWDVEEALRFIDFMKKRYNAKFIAFETHTDLDREEAQRLKGESIFSTYHLSDVSLKLSAALIDKCDLFVGIDSGPMWIATTTKTPIIALFTMTWMQQTAPMRKDSYIVCSEKSKTILTKKFGEEHKDRIVYSAKGSTNIGAEDVIRCLEKLEIFNNVLEGFDYNRGLSPSL